MKSLAVALGLAVGLIGVAVTLRAARARDDRGATVGCGWIGSGARPRRATSPSPARAAPRGEVVAVPAPSALALRYHRGGNIIWAVELALGWLLPALLLVSGLSARLRTLAATVGRGHFYPTLLVYLALLSTLLLVISCRSRTTSATCASTPTACRPSRSRSGRPTPSRAGRWASVVARRAVGSLSAAGAQPEPLVAVDGRPLAAVLHPRHAGDPGLHLALFNEFGPMKDEALEGEVLADGGAGGSDRRAGVRGEQERDTEKVNAYVTGVGRTKRIVLWDTLLARLSPRQVRFVVGHELGHYVLGHVWSSILISSALTLLGLYGVHRVADALLGAFGARFGFSQLSDPASMPLFMLLLSLFSFVITPAVLALSRYHEREADRFGLELTHDNRAAATGFVALQKQNLAVPRPGPWFEVFRASHPSIGERIDFINSYRPWESGRPGRYDHLLLRRP